MEKIKIYCPVQIDKDRHSYRSLRSLAEHPAGAGENANRVREPSLSAS